VRQREVGVKHDRLAAPSGHVVGAGVHALVNRRRPDDLQVGVQVVEPA
jgi:hypothetical protein